MLKALDRIAAPTRPVGTSKPTTRPTSSSAPIRDALQLGSQQWYYRGISQGFQVNWTNRDLEAWRAQDMSQTKPTFSLRRNLSAPCVEGEFRCLGQSETRAELTAQVGRTLGYLETTGGYVPGAMHDWANTTFTTVDMESGKPLALTDVFAKPALYQALMKDRLVQQALGGAKPANFDALVDALDGKMAPDERYQFSRKMFQNFTFDHLEGNQVAVRLAIPYGTQAYRGTLTQLGLLLPMSGLNGVVSATDLHRAADRTAGILWSDAGKIGHETKIELKNGVLQDR